MRNAGESRKETCMRMRALTHPKKTVRVVEKERAELGLKSWAAAAAVAKNRDRWRALTSGPIPHLGARN